MIKQDVYLKNRRIPMITTRVICDKCSHIINAGPNYIPKFCDMCGAPISDDLSKIKWLNEETSVLTYVKHFMDNESDYEIYKVKYECTDWAMIGLQPDIEHIPVFIGHNLEEIIELNKDLGHSYEEDDFERATKAELIAYSRACGNHWV